MTYIYVKRELRKKNHDVHMGQAGAYTKYRWAQRNGFLKSRWD